MCLASVITAVGMADDIAVMYAGRVVEQAPTQTLFASMRLRSHEGGYFIRLTVEDRAGVFATIAKSMADNGISLESIVQHSDRNQSDDQKTVILVTHETTEAAVREAIDGITKDGHLVDHAQVIRIERAG